MNVKGANCELLQHSRDVSLSSIDIVACVGDASTSKAGCPRCGVTMGRSRLFACTSQLALHLLFQPVASASRLQGCRHLPRIDIPYMGVGTSGKAQHQNWKIGSHIEDAHILALQDVSDRVHRHAPRTIQNCVGWSCPRGHSHIFTSCTQVARNLLAPWPTRRSFGRCFRRRERGRAAGMALQWR